ncbi:MAG: T9SS type A sorting domain-containing protein [Lewinellaceae bacterium]|nr:T9SS type A sorting domain-containing protein [Lewinellaceae bacterium]
MRRFKYGHAAWPIFAALRVFPNPAANKWIVSLESQQINTVEVFDMLGRQILLVFPNQETVEIDASSLKPGNYMAKITTNAGSNFVSLIKA